MATIRELIIQDFMNRAAVIRTPVYETDMGAAVFRATPKGDPDEAPCCIIWPKQEEAENIHGQCRHRMVLLVEGLVKFGLENPSVISERILGDLIKCFTSPAWVRSPDRIESIIYQAGDYEAPGEAAIIAGAQATFLVTYWTTLGDPGSQ